MSDGSLTGGGIEWALAIDAAAISDFFTGGNRLDELVEQFANGQQQPQQNVDAGDGGDQPEQPAS